MFIIKTKFNVSCCVFKTKTKFCIMLKIVCALCLYFHLTVANGSCSQKMFEIINGKKMEIGIFYSQQMSKSECAASCAADDNCFAATFDVNNQNCKMHNTISNRTDSSSTMILLNIHGEVLSISMKKPKDNDERLVLLSSAEVGYTATNRTKSQPNAVTKISEEELPVVMERNQNRYFGKVCIFIVVPCAS